MNVLFGGTNVNSLCDIKKMKQNKIRNLKNDGTYSIVKGLKVIRKQKTSDKNT